MSEHESITGALPPVPSKRRQKCPFLKTTMTVLTKTSTNFSASRNSKYRNSISTIHLQIVYGTRLKQLLC